MRIPPAGHHQLITMIRIPALGLAVACLVSAAAATPTDPQGCPAPVNFCDPGCYDLGNKVTGQVAPPNYGLRLDGLFGSPSSHWTFDFEAQGAGVQMCNDGLGTITIDGIAYGGLDVGGAWDPAQEGFLEIHFVYENAACVNGKLLVLESNSGLAYGTVKWENTGEVIYLSGKANNAGEIFLFDGHTGDPARGWVMYGNGSVGDFAMTVQPTTDCLPEPDCDGDNQPDWSATDCNSNGVPDSCEELPSCACPLPEDFCDAGCWRMGDKQTGAVAPPGYGLRLDGLFGAASDHWTFGYELPGTAVTMCYDGAGTITVDGLAYGGRDIGGVWDANDQGYLEIHFTYENAACVNGKLLVLDSNDGLGYGTVKWLNTGEIVPLVHKLNGQGEAFLFDGHAGDPARGWLMYGDGRSGDFGMTAFATNDCPPDPDCDGDGIADAQELDCNGNGVPDDCETLADCDADGIPDVCAIANGALDANQNGIPDVCEPDIEVFCVPDPQGVLTVPCPCGNVAVPGATSGCANSTGSGATLSATGSPSIAAADLALTITGVPDHEPGIFISGLLPEANGAGTPFGAGVLCIGGPLVRLQKVPGTPGAIDTMPAPGELPIWQQLGALPGQTHYFQFWYRDHTGPCGGRANFSNALRVTFGL